MYLTLPVPTEMTQFIIVITFPSFLLSSTQLTGIQVREDKKFPSSSSSSKKGREQDVAAVHRLEPSDFNLVDFHLCLLPLVEAALRPLDMGFGKVELSSWSVLNHLHGITCLPLPNLPCTFAGHPLWSPGTCGGLAAHPDWRP